MNPARRTLRDTRTTVTTHASNLSWLLDYLDDRSTVGDLGRIRDAARLLESYAAHIAELADVAAVEVQP